MEDQTKIQGESELGHKGNNSMLSLDLGHKEETKVIYDQSDDGSADDTIEKDPALISLRRFFFF